MNRIVAVFVAVCSFTFALITAPLLAFLYDCYRAVGVNEDAAVFVVVLLGMIMIGGGLFLTVMFVSKALEAQ